MSNKQHKVKKIPNDKLNKIPFIKKINVNLHDFSEIHYVSGLQILNVSGNPIKTFKNMPVLPVLHTLIVDNTQIFCLEGAVGLPALQQLSLQNTPLSTEENYDLMCLSAFGSTINNLNDSLVSKSSKKLANKIRPKLYPYLFNGYLLESVDPLIVSMPNQLPEKKITLDLEPSDLQEKDAEIEENKKKIEELKKKLHRLQKQKRDLAQGSEEQVLQSFRTPIQNRQKKTPTKRTSKNSKNTSSSQTTNKQNDNEQIQQEPDTQKINEETTAIANETTEEEETVNNQITEEVGDLNYEKEFMDENSNDNVEAQKEENSIKENDEIVDEPEIPNNEDNQKDYLGQFMDEEHNENDEAPNENEFYDENEHQDQFPNDANPIEAINEEPVANNDQPLENNDQIDAIDNQNPIDIQDDNQFLNELMSENENAIVGEQEQNEDNQEQIANNGPVETTNDQNVVDNQDDKEYLNQLMDEENAADANNDQNIHENQDDNDYLQSLINDQNDNDGNDDDEAILQQLMNEENNLEETNDPSSDQKRMGKPPIPANSKTNQINISALRQPPVIGHKMMSSASIDQELNAIKAIDPPDIDNSGYIKPEGNDYDNLSEIVVPTTPIDDHSIDDILNGADISNDDI